MGELFQASPRSVRPNTKNKQTITRQQAQRFILQVVVALFAEDIDLLPAGMVKSLVDDCLQNKMSSYDLFGGLFHQMNNEHPATGGRYEGVRYFNGGLFATIEPIEMTEHELEALGGEDGAAMENWSKVQSLASLELFSQSMDAKERHLRGAHYTSEADIQRIIVPTIVRPWLEQLMRHRLLSNSWHYAKKPMEFRVLDPACGSGNFLYVSYRELARLETRLLARLQETMSN